MRGSDGKPAPVDRGIRVQFRADTEDAAVPEIDRCPLRGNPPREPDDVPVPHHGIVAPVYYLPVVGEEEISVPVQLRHRGVDLRDHRVTGHVGAGHDQERMKEMREEKVVKAGIGKHAANGVDVADVRMGRMVPFFEDHDRVDRAFQQFFVLRKNQCKFIDIVRPDHDRERLLDPAEAVLQRSRRLLDA